MATRALIPGALLIAVGVIVTLASDSSSVTSLIPAFIGVAFVILGLIGRARPEIGHHVMHAAAGLALLAVVGSAGSVIGRGSTGWALFAQLCTIAIAGVFLAMAVMSFREARRARVDAAG